MHISYLTIFIFVPSFSLMFIVWKWQGFKDVRNMGGGYLAWLENRFSIKKPEDELQQVIKLKEVIDKP